MAVTPCAVRIVFAVRDGSVDESVTGDVVTLKQRTPFICGCPCRREIASKLAKVTSRAEHIGHSLQDFCKESIGKVGTTEAVQRYGTTKQRVVRVSAREIAKIKRELRKSG